MPDSISISSTIGGTAALVAACGKTIKYLYGINQTYRDAGSITRSITQELATIQCAWNVIQDMLEQRKYLDDMNHELLLQLNQTIEHGRQTLTLLNNELSSAMKLSSTGEQVLRRRSAIVWNERRLRTHQDRIRGQIMSMSLLISLLRSPASRQQRESVEYDSPIIYHSPHSSSYLPDQSSALPFELEGQDLENHHVYHEMSIGGTTHRELSVINEALYELEDDNFNHQRSFVSSLPSSPTIKRKSQFKDTRKHQHNLNVERSSRPIVQNKRRHSDGELATQVMFRRPEDINHIPTDSASDADEESIKDATCMRLAPLNAKVIMISKQKIQDGVVNDSVPSLVGNPLRDSPKRQSKGHADEGNIAVQLPAEDLKDQSSPDQLESALHYACQRGDIRIVNEILKENVNVHSRVQEANSDLLGPTTIHLTAMHGHSDVALILLKHGARPNDHGHGHRRPLHEAAESSNETMISVLLEHGARPNVFDNDGIEPLHIACRNGSLKIARLLIDAGASVSALDNDMYHPLHHLAQGCGDPYFATFLIDQGCDLEAKTSQGYTALQLACISGNIQLLEVLLYHGASPEAGERLAKPLALAIAGGHMRTARYLLESGVEVNYHSPNTHETIVHLVAGDIGSKSGRNRVVNGDVISLLRQYGANINSQDARGDTPLHVAVSAVTSRNRQSQRATVNALLKNGARADIQNYDGCYPLTLASRNPDFQIFRVVLAASIDRLPDKHLAGIDREMRKEKEPALRSSLKEITPLLRTALVARAL